MNKESSTVRDTVLQKITEQHVAPTPAWRFVLSTYGMWCLWLLLVFVGAAAVAVTCFVVSYRRFAFFEATHPNASMLLIDTLPYLWLVVFVAGSALAYINLRCCGRAYRHSWWVLLGTSATASVAGGVLLHSLGWGLVIDQLAGERMPLMQSQAALEYRMWQNPAEGRLIGAQVQGVASTSEHTIVFKDIAGVRWDTDVSELMLMDLALLAHEGRVRLLGIMHSTTTNTFHACGAFPWLLDKPMPRQELSSQRQQFVERIYRFDHDPATRAELIEATLPDHTRTTSTSLCAELIAIKRMKETMR